MLAGCCLLIAKRGIWIARPLDHPLRGVAALFIQRNQVGPGISAAVVLLTMVAQISPNTLNHIQYIARAEMSVLRQVGPTMEEKDLWTLLTLVGC
jgi:hypothetical protein